MQQKNVDWIDIESIKRERDANIQKLAHLSRLKLFANIGFALLTTTLVVTLITALYEYDVLLNLQLFKDRLPSLPRILTYFAGVVSVIFLGTLLYFARCRQRLYYGLTEMMVGAYTAIKVIWPSTDLAALASLITILGGLYIIVRGMDNIDKALQRYDKKSTRMWNKIFYPSEISGSQTSPTSAETPESTEQTPQ